MTRTLPRLRHGSDGDVVGLHYADDIESCGVPQPDCAGIVGDGEDFSAGTRYQRVDRVTAGGRNRRDLTLVHIPAMHSAIGTTCEHEIFTLTEHYGMVRTALGGILERILARSAQPNRTVVTGRGHGFRRSRADRI